MKQERWAIAAVCLVLGMMLVIQFRTTQGKAANDVRVQRTGDLALKLEETEQQRDGLQKQLEQIKKQGTLDSIQKENQTLKYRAGMTEVVGKGVIVTIEDSHLPVKTGENPNLYIIHDEDVLRIINELRAAGAEALAINDQRLVGTSEIRCVGPTITVNRKSFAPPYVVRAIGNPDTLAGALQLRGGVMDTLKHWGIQLTIKKEEQVVVPAFTGAPPQEYGKTPEGSHSS